MDFTDDIARYGTHDCPICGTPTFPSWDFGAVCAQCAARTRCSAGRLVSGYNTDNGFGFAATHYSEGGEREDECIEVTESHACWIGDRECVIGPAKFGGVMVEAADVATYLQFAKQPAPPCGTPRPTR